MSTVADRPQAADPLALPPPSPWALARARVRSYVSLTKPRIVELLLITTVPAMVVAAGGLPSLWLVLVTLVGGSLAAGHPFAATGGRIVAALAKTMSKENLSRGLVSVCAADGQGVVAVLEAGNG